MSFEIFVSVSILVPTLQSAFVVHVPVVSKAPVLMFVNVSTVHTGVEPLSKALGHGTLSTNDSARLQKRGLAVGGGAIGTSAGTGLQLIVLQQEVTLVTVPPSLVLPILQSALLTQDPIPEINPPAVMTVVLLGKK